MFILKNLKVFFLFSIFLFPQILKAEITSHADTLNAGATALGVSTEIYMEPAEYQADINFGYGITNKMDLNFRFGLSTIDIYLGADLEYKFYTSEKIDFSTSIGAHFQDEFFIDATPLMAYKFNKFSLLTGFDINLMLAKHDNSFGLNWVLGTFIPIRNNMSFLADLGLNLSNYYNWISAGLIFNL